MVILYFDEKLLLSSVHGYEKMISNNSSRKELFIFNQCSMVFFSSSFLLLSMTEKIPCNVDSKVVSKIISSICHAHEHSVHITVCKFLNLWRGDASSFSSLS